MIGTWFKDCWNKWARQYLQQRLPNTVELFGAFMESFGMCCPLNGYFCSKIKTNWFTISWFSFGQAGAMVAAGAPSSFETVEQIAAHLGYAPKLAYTIHSDLWLGN